MSSPSGVTRFWRGTTLQPSSGRGLARLRVDLVQDRLEQPSGGEDVLTREHPRALRTPRGNRVADRAVLPVVLHVQLVEVRPGSPYRLDEERPPRRLRHPLDERHLGRAVDDVVKGVVLMEPVASDLEVLASLVTHLDEPFGRTMEAPL